MDGYAASGVTAPEVLPEPLMSPEGESAAHKVEGNAAIAGGRLQDAVAAFSRAVDACPDLPVPYNNRAQAQLKLGKHSACVRDATTALELQPAPGGAVKALHRRAQARGELGDWTGAVADLKVRTALVMVCTVPGIERILLGYSCLDEIQKPKQQNERGRSTNDFQFE